MTKPVIVKRLVKGSSLTYAEHDLNFQNLADATVTLTAGTGGTGVASDLNGNITLVAGTNVTITGDNTAKTITINSTGGGGGLTDIVNDTTPQLGGNLDVNGKSIVSVNGGDIVLATSASFGLFGSVKIQNGLLTVGNNLILGSDSRGGAGEGVVSGSENLFLFNQGITTTDTASILLSGRRVKFGNEDNIELSYIDTNNGKFMGTVRGNVETSSISPLTSGGTVQLGGNLSVNGFKIVSEPATNGNIVLEPNGVGDVLLKTDTVRVGTTIAAQIFALEGKDLVVGVLDSTPGAAYVGTIKVESGANGNIIIDPHGTGTIELKAPLTVNATSGTPTTFANGYYENMLVTPVSWLKITVGSSEYYLPLYQ